MSDLIKINFDGEKQTTSARYLWEFLERPWGEFMKWFNQFKDYGFTENHDYKVIEQLLENSKGGRPAKDYEITIDMAKELAMLQKTEKGKQARQYFIEVEKKWNSPELLMARALKMSDTKLLEYKEKLTQLETKIVEDKPKVLFADAVSTSGSTILVNELAKLLKQNGFEIGGNRLFQWLRENGYLIKRKGTDYNTPTQKSMELGLFKIKETAVTHSDGHITVNKTTKVTGKGQTYFVNKFLSQLTTV